MSISLVTGQFGRVYTALGLIAAGVVAFQIAAIPILHEIAILTPNSPYLQYSYCVMGFAVFLAMAIGSHVSSVIGICGFAAIVTLGAIWAVRRA